ncbi:MAG: ATP-dependent DNA helicase [Candidatus Methanoplasma sp.]|nr:ATP-dependent DNA helicase [Candidatus Methanoplasma sp.]
MEQQFCPNCSSIIFPNQKKCGSCGRAVDRSSGIGLDSFLNRSQPEKKMVKEENPEAPYLPYEPRPMQLEIITDVRRAIDEGRHIVMESGTGTGKTIVSLAAGLEHAMRTGKKIVYLTRTISQSDQVMKELRAISTIKQVSGITITGRNKSCPLFAKEGLDDLPPNVLSLMCDDKKKKSMNDNAGGCRFFDRTKAEINNVMSYCLKEFPTSAELDTYCEKAGVCPYEMKKMLMKEMDVVVAPYIHILSEDIRTNFIANLGGEDVPLLLIVDEAHNLIDAARDQESFSITMRMIEAAMDECTVTKTGETLNSIKIEDVIKFLKAAIKQLATQNISLGVKEFRLGKDALESLIMKRFNVTRNELNVLIEDMIGVGDRRMDTLSEKGDFSISEIYTLGVALRDWVMSDNDRYVRSVKTSENGEYLFAACIDPSDIVKFMQEQQGAVHMSGTLQPLEQYYKVMGLPRTAIARTYPSPFPKENRSVIYVDDVTTKYDKRDPVMMSRIENRIIDLCNAVEKNTLVFFPSYKMMKDMRASLELKIKKPMFWEESGQQKRTMNALNAFRRGSNGVFFSVMGGSVAEGIDFPGEELCFTIIVGIPYPPPSLELKAMSDMFDARYGPRMGWRYTSEVPAIRKIRQAIGRMIRTETDYGMAVILDSRVSEYQRQLEATLSKHPVKDAVDFFSKR